MKISGAILCGGLNTRMGGRVKGLLQLNGQNFLEMISSVLKPLVSEVLVVTRPDLDLAVPGLRQVHDLYDVRCSLTGVHGALKQAQYEQVLVVACDSPLLSPALVKMLLEEAQTEEDVVVPRVAGYLEPLSAVYSRSCLPYIENLLSNKVYKIKDFYGLVRIKIIEEEKIRQVDPGLYSFLNINTQTDYEQICNLVEGNISLRSS